MIQAPTAAYDGWHRRDRGDEASQGQEDRPNAAAVSKYVGHLKAQHDEALPRSAAARSSTTTTYAFNGFAAKLTDGQAGSAREAAGRALGRAGRRSTRPTRRRRRTFLGLTPPGGLWDKLGGRPQRRSRDGAGENIIIGVIDSGIWPESTSFTDRGPQASGKLIYQQIPRLARQVHAGRGLERLELCNKKLIGAQHFNAGVGRRRRDRGRPAVGVHVAARLQRSRHAHGVDRRRQLRRPGDRPRGGFGKVSGMAPRARDRGVQGAAGRRRTRRPASGFTADLVAAIDQAVADGVDVINYSISGTPTNFLDPVRGRVPVRRGRGRLRRRVGRQQRPDRLARSRTRARGSRPSRPARTTATARARSRSATA